MSSTLPSYVPQKLIAERLPIIFPPGTPVRNNCIKDAAANTIFSMIYIGAIEGSGILWQPVHTYRMTEEQSSMIAEEERVLYRKKFKAAGHQRWYADNSREQVRDDVVREGLVVLGAVILDKSVITTANKARYCLQRDFSDLFEPNLIGNYLEKAIVSWQNANLTTSALARVKLANQLLIASEERVLITFPNKEAKSIPPGKSSLISKAIIEIFAIHFLKSPVVLWLSTSAEKVANYELASSIGITIKANKNLPDIILVDLGPADPLIVFVEVVATDGAVTERRQNALYELADEGKFKRSQVAFVTAYADRDSPEFKKTVNNLAWRSFAWFVSEPEKILVLKDGIQYLSSLLEDGKPNR